MPSLAVIRASNAAFAPSYPPVALFVGGTSGIGQAMAEAFANYTKGNAQVIIIGRNKAAADAIIAKLPPSTVPGVSHEFVKCDVTLMKNVQATTTELLTRIPKINFLVMTAGFMNTKGRDETEEGIDRKLAAHYYSRWKFTSDLMPALRKAKDSGEDAKVFSVLGAGAGGEIDTEDLGLKKSFSLANAALAAPTYNDLMMEEFSEKNPDMTFIHARPGAVRTGLLKNSDSSIVRMTSVAVQLLARPFTVSPAECADYMLHSLLNNGNGVFRAGSLGEDIGKQRYFGSEQARKKLWEHTVESTRV
ncbi:hypothetical protein BD779DRAFT_1450321 [Infundibulicybe gibba]|nr:hypothetical protein BD779DRAFT_1450321 [Infundibulicybe gibba]